MSAKKSRAAAKPAPKAKSKAGPKTPMPVAKAKVPSSALEEAYNDFPYESYVYPQTHPERMHTIASLFQMDPPNIHRARILEIGCASGGNILPLAALYPETKILGVDLSGAQIALANESKKEMGLKNIEFQQMDIMKFPKDAGKFDYIICHGVLSWVPDSVRGSVFKVIREHLTPKGLALISYNVLPGWSAVKSLRDMMIFHTQGFPNPAQQIHESRQLLNFLYENATGGNEAYKQIIDRERQMLSSSNDSYIFHEHLEAENHQFYLHEFVTQANANKLAYVGDAEISTMYIGNFNEKVRQTLGQIKDIVRQEQYIDFLINRRFRHSIVTRAENAPSINRNLTADRIGSFYISARYRPEGEPGPDGKMKFTIPDTLSSFETGDRPTSLAFKTLAEMGRPAKLEEIAAEAHLKYDIPLEATRACFEKNGFNLALQGFIGLQTDTIPYAREAGIRPRAFSLARHMAKRKNATSVTNIRREKAQLPIMHIKMLPLLDGTRTRGEIADELTKLVLMDELKMMREGKPITEKNEIHGILLGQIDATLQRFADAALLEE